MPNSPGINSLVTGAISDNNPFVGTRYFALHEFPNNQYYLWFFQWTVSPLRESLSPPRVSIMPVPAERKRGEVRLGSALSAVTICRLKGGFHNS